MHWLAHLAECPQQFNAAKLLSATTTIVRVGNHRRTCLTISFPNPSTACVDDFAVHGNVVLGLRLLETVMPTRVPRNWLKHQTQPPQTTGFDQVAITGTDWVTIDTLSCNSLALRRSIVSSIPITSPWGKYAHKLLQQQSARLRLDHIVRLSTR